MTTEESIGIMMSDSNSAVVESLTVTANGTYTPPAGVDGYNPVHVNVESSEADIQSLTVTENGTYRAADYGCEGFDPVNVNVPDRYDEGYEQGVIDGIEQGKESVVIEPLMVTQNGTYYAADYGYDGFDPVNVNVPENGKYTFPEGTSYDDIRDIVKGDNVTDETLGVSIVTTYNDDSTWNQERIATQVEIVLSDGTKTFMHIYNAPAEEMRKVISVDVNSSSGEWVITYQIANTSQLIYVNGQSDALIGYGSDDHTFSVSNAE